MKNEKLSRFLCSVTLIVMSLFFTSCAKEDTLEPINDTTIPSEYKLVWADEFNQSSGRLDVTKWNYDTGYGNNGWGNDEWQEYTNSPANIHVQDGNLIITARCESGVPAKRDGSVTSARITTNNKFTFKFGKIQARIKTPKSMGMWSAFWMLGSNYDTDGWPKCGEMDIMEMHFLYSDDKTAHSTLHWWDDGAAVPGWTYDGSKKTFDYSLTDDYHVYEIDWDENRVIGKVDNVAYFTKPIAPDTMEEFLNDFFIILNLAVGGTLGGAPDKTTQWPQEMYVDWVRVYKKELSAETIGIYSESHTQPALNYLQIFDSNWWGANRVVANEKSTEVKPLEGNYVLSTNFINAGAGWGGFLFNFSRADISDYAALVFSLDKSAMPALATMGIELEDTKGGKKQVSLTSYSPTVSGNWATYEIPLRHFIGVNLGDIKFVGFWNPKDQQNELLFGTLYFDDIYLKAAQCTGVGSVSLNAETYTASATKATIAIVDECAAGKRVVVAVNNGAETIAVGTRLDAGGNGTATVKFGPTNDNTGTIAIAKDNTLTVSYTDINGNVKTDAATITAAATTDKTAGVFSESHTDAMVTYTGIINSADWSGNPATPNEKSTDVPPVDGTYVLSVDFGDGGKGWGGIAFNFGDGQNVASYTKLILYMNKSAVPALADLGVKLEDVSTGNVQVQLKNFTPVISGNWAKYELPLSLFPAVNLTKLKYIGLWNPTNSAGNPVFGKIYFDDIYFSADAPVVTTGAGIFSESHTTATVAYEKIINSADWSGNPASPNEQSTDVPPVDGTYILAVDFGDGGKGWGGIAFFFGDAGTNISAYTKLVFSVNKTAMPNLADLGVKFEDVAVGNTQVQLKDYTPTISGNWAKYEIPLSRFPAADKTKIKYLGLWNPANSSSALVFGKLYFDDIYLAK